MKKLLNFGLLLFLLLPTLGIAQITFFNIPSDFAIIPRNTKTNSGTFRVNGEVTFTQYKSVELRAYVKGVLTSKVSKQIYFSGSSAPFDLQIIVPAGLINYEFQIYASDGFGAYLKRTVKQVAFGDIILITGQSNSVANSYNGLANSSYSDSFIRSFGNSTYIESDAANDLQWHLADGDGYYSSGCIGQWGLVLAKQIIDSAKVPIGIINNGVGGTPIDYHKKNYSSPMDLKSSYGRQLYRASKCYVANEARYMMYYQGESDGSNAKLHDSLFKIMHRDWLIDYPGLLKVYVVQVRDGCGSPSLQLREVQRQFEFKLSRTRTLTVNGFNGHDGCHFGFANGYQSLGFEAAQVLLTEFYGKKTKNDVYPLNPLYAYISNSNLKQITLELNQADQTLKADANFYELFQLESNPSTSIVGGKIINNKIVLNLSSTICSLNGLSYNGAARANPWVTNLKGIGLLSFYKLPIYASKRVSNTMRVCKNKTFKLSCDSVAGYSYIWKGNNGNFLSKLANPSLKLDSSEIFKLIIEDNLKICKADTQYVTVLVEEVPKPNFDSDYHLCTNDSLQINLNSPGNQTSWTRDNIKISSLLTSIKLAGSYIINVASGLGCTNSDSFKVTKTLALNLIDSIYYHCPETALRIQSKHAMRFYRWNNQLSDSNSSYWFDTGIVSLVALDTNDCYHYDTARVNDFYVEPINFNTNPVFCEFDQFVFLKPITTRKWFWNSKAYTTNFYAVSLADSLHALLLDSNNCEQNFDIIPSIIKKPAQSMSQYILCEGKDVLVKLDPKYTYQWQSGTSSANVTIYTSGVHRFKVFDNFCEFNDSITVSVSKKPVWNIPTDTSLCSGQKIKLLIPQSLFKVRINNLPIKDSILLEFPQGYVISGADGQDCKHTWYIIIREKTCVNSSKIQAAISFDLYPNPTSNELIIQSNSNFGKEISIELFNTLGERITNFEVIQQTEKSKLLLRQLSKGIYFLKLDDSNGSGIYKIVIN